MSEGAPPPIDASAGTPVPEKRDDKAWLAAHGGKINAPPPPPGSAEAAPTIAQYFPADLSEGNLEAKEVSDKRRDAIRALFKDPLAGGDKILLTGIKQVLDKPNRRFDLPPELNNPETHARVKKLLERLDQGQSLGSIFGEARDASDQPTIDAIRALARHGLEQFAPKAGEEWGDFARKNPVQAKWVRGLEQLVLMGGAIKAVHEENTNSLAKEKREGLAGNLQLYAAQPDVPELQRQFFEHAYQYFAEASLKTLESTSQPEPAATTSPPEAPRTSEAAPPPPEATAPVVETPLPASPLEADYEQLRVNPDFYRFALEDRKRQLGPNVFDKSVRQYQANHRLEGMEDRFNQWLTRAIPDKVYQELYPGDPAANAHIRHYLAHFAENLNSQELKKGSLLAWPERMVSEYKTRRELLSPLKALAAPWVPSWRQALSQKRHDMARELYRVSQESGDKLTERLALAITEINLADMQRYASYDKAIRWTEEGIRADIQQAREEFQQAPEPPTILPLWVKQAERAQRQEALRLKEQRQANERIQMSRRKNQLLEEARRANLPAAERLKLEKEEEELRRMQLENIKRQREESEATSEPAEDEDEQRSKALREAETLREQQLRNEALRLKNARERERLRREREERRRRNAANPPTSATP